MISQSKITDKQQDILNAALRLFVNYGFHGTPTSAIAKEAGIANGTLFHYYKTKDELIVALYIHIKLQMTECMQQEEQGATLKEVCRKIYTSALIWGLDNDTAFRFLQQFMNSPYVAMLPDDMKKHNLAWMELLKDGIKRKELKPMEPEYLATVLMSHLFGTGQYMSTSKLGAAARRKMIAESFELVWDMVSSK